MDYEKDDCKKVDVEGVIAGGKQFDIEIMIPEDNRDVIYGVLKDCYQTPIRDAVVKLLEVDFEHGKKEKKPVSHTFTDKDGAFVFGPLCPHKKYEIQFWANKVEHVKMCAKCTHEGPCLKGVKMDKCDFECEKHCHRDSSDCECSEECSDC